MTSNNLDEIPEDDGTDEIPEDEHARAEQLALNLHWLIARIDVIHECLCPKQYGSWQQRAEQAVLAARKLKNKEFE